MLKGHQFNNPERRKQLERKQRRQEKAYLKKVSTNGQKSKNDPVVKQKKAKKKKVTKQRGQGMKLVDWGPEGPPWA